MLKLNTSGETPPGGWKYLSENGVPFPDKGEGMIHGFDVLQAKVMEHRKATGGDLDVGWLERFIDELCRQNPEYPCVHEAPYSERKIGLPEVKRFVFAVQKFIESGGKVVSREKANERAAICKRCPKNIELGGCLGCTTVLSVASSLIPNIETDHDLYLRSCGVCGCVLRTKVWLPVEVMPEDTVKPEDWPSWCWVKNELQEQS